MKRQLLKAWLVAVSVIPGFAVSGADDASPVGYGILALSSDQPGLTNHLVSFPLEDDGTEIGYTSAVSFTQTSTAGAYATDAYYMAATTLSGGKELPSALIRMDISKGTWSKVGDLDGFYALINDMTYDHSTSTMYMVSRISESVSALFTVDLANASTRKVADLDRRFFTLAASWDGQLYGVSFAGEFCRIGKTDGKVTVVGPTGFSPNKFQSMEFDHQNKTLWWATTARYLNESGTIQLDEALIATIDPATGVASKKRSLGDDQIAGLYIPYVVVPDAAPRAVGNLAVTPAPDGVYTADLSWTNPSLTFSGAPIKQLTKVDVLRDGVKVGTVNTPQSGSVSGYSDVIASSGGGMHTYTVVASTSAGEGIPVSVTSFVGTDIPAAVTGLRVDRISSSSARVSWEPVAVGCHGGWTDTGSMRYNVVRNPDAVAVASGLAATEWTEPGVDEAGSYSYTVTAVNSAGESKPAVSEAIALGPESGFPHIDDFSAEEFAKWTVIDANGDGNRWQYSNISWAGASGAYMMCSSADADDWLVSLPFDFESGSSYKITFTYLAMGNHEMEVNLLKDYTVASPAVKCGMVKFPRGYKAETLEFPFQVSEGGSYNIAFHEVTSSGNSYLLIDHIIIEKVVDNNLAALSISGNSHPNDGNTYPYGVKIENRGLNPRSDFAVELIDQNGALVGSVTVSEPVMPGSTVIVNVDCTVSQALTSLRGRINDPVDQIASDNITPSMDIEVMPQGTPEEVWVGSQNGTTRNQPFDLYRKYGVSQQVFSSKEIGVPKGRIFSIAWPYNASTYTQAPKGVDIKIYLANTSRVSAQGWIPADSLVLAYEGSVDMEQGDHMLDITLDEAFEYSGGNLAVVTEHSLENAGAAYYSGVYWPSYTSPLEENSSFNYANDTKFAYGSVSGQMSSSGNSVIVFQIQTGGADVSGKVTDSVGNPVEGVSVRVEELKVSSLTAADGTYSFSFVPNGTYTVTASRMGYTGDEKREVTVDDRDVTLNLTVEKMPVARVSGRIVSSDGKPLADAEVTLDGYMAMSALTSSEGTFSFPEVVCHKSSVMISKDWYAPAFREFDLTADTDLGDITAGFAHYSAGTPEADDTSGTMMVSWTSPDLPAQIRYDSGEVASQFGITSEVGTSVMGTLFRTPMTVDTIRWQTTYEGGPHNTLNLYVYDLDENGKPTSKLLYSERSIWNVDGEWNVYALPEPIEAPNGCLVTLNYPGFLGIAIDEGGREYPFRKGTYWFSTDFNSGEFSSLEDKGLAANLLIRVDGRMYPQENNPVADVSDNRDALPGWYAYNVWRASGSQPSDNDWKLLTPTPQDALSFTDTEWASLAPGIYRYAVAPVYPDGSMSQRAVSKCILHDTYASLNIEAVTNSHSADASGARAVLANSDNSEKYEAEIGPDGKARVEGVWKDIYTLSLSLPGYETLSAQIDLRGSSEVTAPAFVLKEIIATPVNLNVTSASENAYMFTWNETGEITESFESGYTLFASPEGGRLSWTCLDRDGGRTFAESAFDFPGRTRPMSFIVFDPKQTSPSMYDSRPSSHPRTGERVLACFSALYGNDDWLISPRLTYHAPFQFSFWAKGYSQTYVETLMVGYSSVSADPSTFRWLDEEQTVPMQQWKKYEYEIPAEARYVAIRSTSSDGFTLFIDDVEIGVGTGMDMNVAVSGPEVAYEVSVDGRTIGVTDKESMLLSGLTEGVHTASVRAVYASGKSDEARFVFGQDGVGTVRADELSVWPNPAKDHTNISGQFTGAALYALSGTMVRRYGDESTMLDLTGVAPGIYILQVNGMNGVRSFKLTVR